MTEQDFWAIIESSWADSPKLDKRRAKALKTNDEELLTELSEELEDTILDNYKNRLADLDKDKFTEFIHRLEEKLYKIDRQEVQEYTDGSDDEVYEEQFGEEFERNTICSIESGSNREGWLS